MNSLQPRAIDTFFAQDRAWIVALVMVGLSVFKAGLVFEVSAQSPDLAFPLPEVGMTPTSFGMPFAVTVSGLKGHVSGIGFMMFAATVLMLFIFSIHLLRSDRSAGLIVAGLTLLGPIGVVAFGNVGRNDWFLIAGSLLFALRGERLSWALAAAFVMALGNPEQAFIALAAFLLLASTPMFAQFRRSALWSLGFVAVIAVCLTVWVEALGLISRASWIETFIGSGLKNFSLNLPLSVYAAYGVGWIAVALVLLQSKGVARLCVITALILIPFAVTATTDDQTRVFVGVSALMSVALYRWAAPGIAAWLQDTFSAHWRTIMVAVLVIAPAIEITNAGSIRVPYEWLYEFVTSRSEFGAG